ncbi:MAG: M15 family metallopeptidase [Treponemataceae bacterium]
MRYLGQLACFALFLFTALYPITGSTILNGEDVRARLIFEAFRRAFPDRISSLEFKDEEWTAVIDGTRFFWAHGRILPEKEREKWASYRQHVFIAYPDQPKDPRSYSPERIAALREQGDAEARLNGDDHHPAFRAALYGGARRGGAESNLVKVLLFDRMVSVHKRIVQPIKKVNAAVSAAAKHDKETAIFLSSIGSLGAYNWREIRGTTRRSLHSWGLAVDVQPQRTRSKIMFWEWERDRNADWMLVPLKDRWAPPAAVIAAFEKEGFVWGGKWDFYDTMHFEYRPELQEMKKVLSAIGNPGVQKDEQASVFPGGKEALPAAR